MENNQLSAAKLAEKIGVASRNIESNIKKLKELGILIRHGSPKNGYWEVIDCGKKNNEDLWFFIQICQVALLVARLWKVR